MVCGSRGFNNISVIHDCLNWLKPTLILSGGCRGPDKIAEKWARERGIKTLVFVPSWKRYGKAAGPMRNTAMLVENPDLVLAFWDGKSRTADMITKAKAKGIYTRIVSDEK